MPRWEGFNAAQVIHSLPAMLNRPCCSDYRKRLGLFSILARIRHLRCVANHISESVRRLRIHSARTRWRS